jgi:hypothetical protein
VSRLRPISAKRRRLLPLRAAVRVEVLARDVVCQAANRLPDVQCGGPLDVHEIAPRSVDPSAWLDPAKAVLVCRRHHDWIGDNPQAAHEVGLHKFSWEVA